MAPLALANEVVLVTGAGSVQGIGRAIVLECVAQGAKAVYSADLHTDNHATLLEAAQKIRADAVVKSIVLDVGDGDATKEALRQILREQGRFVRLKIVSALLSTLDDL